MATTLEQERAKFAWDIAVANKNDASFKRLAKGAPALIMSNGLMPSLAFWQSKGNTKIVEAILCWLKHRRIVNSSVFAEAMQCLQNVDSVIKFRDATDESLEFLKWLRNFASAVCEKE